MVDTVASADGVAITYEARGAGSPALVFVHGWSCDRTYWRGQVGHFADRHQVVSLDLAGHGDSGAARRAWTMPAFGDDVVAVVEELELDDLVLVGHSMGGDVIVEAALRLDSRVRGLVWVDVYHSLANPRSAAAVERFVAPFRADFAGTTQEFVRGMFAADADAALVERVAKDMSSAPPEIALEAMVHALGNGEAMLEHLPRLAPPIRALNGGAGRTDLDGLRQLGVEAVEMPDVGHFLMLDDPPGFNRLLGEAIAGLR